MTLRFCALASGSRGNALLIEHRETLVMVDCGLSLRALDERLAAAGRKTSDIDAVLITHEHQDHSRGIGPLIRRNGIPVWATPGTAHAVDAIDGYERLRTDRELTIGSIQVRPFAVPHDAREPCQFVFAAKDQRFGLLTDTGHTTPVIHNALKSCDALGLEFNHDAGMLQNGSYPEAVKARVASRYGHLSNNQAADLLSDVMHPDLQWVMGLHLSEKNNSARSVKAAAEQAIDHGATDFCIASQDEPSGWREIRRC